MDQAYSSSAKERNGRGDTYTAKAKSEEVVSTGYYGEEARFWIERD
jgi:hypothetical protein